MKPILIAAISATFVLSAPPVMAGEGNFARSDGFQLKIKCRNSGCTVRGKEPDGKWGVVEKGPGGSSNYKKLVVKYEKMGFREQ